DEVIDLLLGTILLVAVALLELAHQLVLLAADERPVVVGQFAPLRLQLPRKLIPLALEHIPVHNAPPSCRYVMVTPLVIPEVTQAAGRDVPTPPSRSGRPLPVRKDEAL